MHWNLLIGVLLLEIGIIVAVSLAVRRKETHVTTSASADFTHFGGKAGVAAVATTFALGTLGGGHVMGLPAQAAATGVGTYWYCLASGLNLIIIISMLGPWYHRLHYPTLSDFFGTMFDKRFAIVQVGLSTGYLWGITTLEIQGIGTTLAIITSWNLQLACLAGGAIGLLYIIFGGMKEVAWVNVLNAALMFSGLIIAAIYLTSALPEGWAGVNRYYTETLNASWMLDITSNANTWKTYIIGTIIGSLSIVGVNQGSYQTVMTAKNVKTLRKAAYWAIPINVVFGAFTIAFGLAANTLSEYTSVYGGGPMVYMAMLVDKLPTWVLIWLFAGFVAAMLSTIALCFLAISTTITDMLIIPNFKPNTSDKDHLRMLRITIAVVAVISSLVATLIPSINTSMVWLFSWMIPGFLFLVFGLLWRRSVRGVWMVLICGIANCLWTFTSLPAKLGLDGSTNAICMLIVGLIVGIILVGTDKKSQPAIIKTYKSNPAAVVYKPVSKEVV